MNQRAVTEQDFRQEQYRHASPEDYEFAEDGTIVPKDRWRRAVHDLAQTFGLSPTASPQDVVAAVIDDMASPDQHRKSLTTWHFWAADHIFNRFPQDAARIALRLKDGSVLRGATFAANALQRTFEWQGQPVDEAAIVGWRLDP